MDGRAIQESLQRRGVASLCHMTACRRLPSIFEHGGLLPFAERGMRGIAEDDTPHYWGTGKKEALSGYVVCGFMLPWGMCRDKEEEMVVIVLDAIEVCTREGVLFCPVNSARGEVDALELLGKTGVEHLDDCFVNPESWQAYHSEVFVPGIVPLSLFRELRFCDREAADYWPERINRAYAAAIPLATLPPDPIEVAAGDSPRVRFPPGWAPTRRVRDDA